MLLLPNFSRLYPACRSRHVWPLARSSYRTRRRFWSAPSFPGTPRSPRMNWLLRRVPENFIKNKAHFWRCFFGMCSTLNFPVTLILLILQSNSVIVAPVFQRRGHLMSPYFSDSGTFCVCEREVKYGTISEFHCILKIYISSWWRIVTWSQKALSLSRWLRLTSSAPLAFVLCLVVMGRKHHFSRNSGTGIFNYPEYRKPEPEF